MSTAAQALTDLQQAEVATQGLIAALQTAVTNGITQLEALIAQLQQGGGVQPSDIEAVVASMKTDASNLTAVNAQIAAAEASNPLPAKQ